VAAQDFSGLAAKQSRYTLVQLDDLAIVVQEDAFSPGVHLLAHLVFKPPDFPRRLGWGTPTR